MQITPANRGFSFLYVFRINYMFLAPFIALILLITLVRAVIDNDIDDTNSWHG